jgi:sigma-B regulation protein RsbU (phosphoserine phosphatase)
MRKLINSKFMIDEYIEFVENILDGMKDWVRVIDLEDNIVYANKAMKDELGSEVEGKKCYEFIGRTIPCEYCVSKQAVTTLEAMHKEEIISGRVYSVMSSAMKDMNKEVKFVIEVLRDVTQDKLMEDRIKNQNNKFNKDLQISRKMQYNLLPKEITNSKIKFDYIYKPSEMIGGDFFDIFDIDETHIGIYVADVSGHGVPASMLTMFLRQTIKKDELSPAQVLNQLYKKYKKINFDFEQYITMFYSVIDTDAGTIRYANAGHHTVPLIFSEGNERVNYLEARGIPISSWMDKVEYEEHMIQVKPGDMLLFYTDGIIENSNLSGERYGASRLEKFMADNYQNDIADTKGSFIKNMILFIEGAKENGSAGIESLRLVDDITAVFVKIS